MIDLLQDVRYGLRVLRRARGFTVLAVMVLGAGIAASTVIFSALNGVLLRPLPYADPDRLVAIWESNADQHEARAGTSAPTLAEWRPAPCHCMALSPRSDDSHRCGAYDRDRCGAGGRPIPRWVAVRARPVGSRDIRIGASSPGRYWCCRELRPRAPRRAPRSDDDPPAGMMG